MVTRKRPHAVSGVIKLSGLPQRRSLLPGSAGKVGVTISPGSHNGDEPTSIADPAVLTILTKLNQHLRQIIFI